MVLTEVRWIMIGRALQSDSLQKLHSVLGRTLVGALTRTEHIDLVKQIVNVRRWLMNCADNGPTLVCQRAQQLNGIKGG